MMKIQLWNTRGCIILGFEPAGARDRKVMRPYLLILYFLHSIDAELED